MTLQLIIPGRADLKAADIIEASRLYADARDASGEGFRTWPDGSVFRNGAKVARISYNAKVWQPGKWTPGRTPIFNPYREPGTRH